MHNNTNYIITDLNVYSQKFKNLKPNDSTCYKKIVFNELTHNSIINLTVEKKQFIIYITKPNKERSTISIDSLDVENRIIYYKVLQNKYKNN